MKTLIINTFKKFLSKIDNIIIKIIDKILRLFYYFDCNNGIHTLEISGKDVRGYRYRDIRTGKIEKGYIYTCKYCGIKKENRK